MDIIMEIFAVEIFAAEILIVKFLAVNIWNRLFRVVDFTRMKQPAIILWKSKDRMNHPKASHHPITNQIILATQRKSS